VLCRASLALHEYDESRLCLNKLLGLLKPKLETGKSGETGLSAVTVDPATGSNSAVLDEVVEVISATEKLLKKVRSAEMAYKNRDKNIGKRISKGLFEGKDEDMIVPPKDEKIGGSLGGKDIPGNKPSVDGTQKYTSPPAFEEENFSLQENSCVDENSNNSNDQSKAAEEEVSRDTIIPSDLKKKIHPLVKGLYQYQLYYYIAIFVASIAIGHRIS